jgi:ubiquinone/menaquinone biosynthesis C-methylase UbiE
MKQHLETIPRGTLLDAGCGTGHWTRFFVEQDFQVTGIDNSEAMLQIASQKGIAAKFQQKDAVETGFPDEHFDVVATITMLEFVAQPDDVLKELYRILKPGGYLIAGGLNRDSVLGKTAPQDPVFQTATFFTPDEWEHKLQLFGIPEIKKGVYITDDFNIPDETPANIGPAFIACKVQKIK